MSPLRAIWWWGALAGVLAGVLAGCAPSDVRPPVTAAQLSQSRSSLPPRVVQMHNLQRVLDPQLPAPERLESLAVARQMGGPAPAEAQRLRELSVDEQAPAMLRTAVADWLASGAYESAAAAPALITGQGPSAGAAPAPGPALSPAGGPAVEGLDRLVVQWSGHDPPNAQQDGRYRQAVSDQAQGRPWDTVLLDAINRPDFQAAGPAVALLSRQVGPRQLSAAVSRLPAHSQAVAVLQGYLRLFDYLPATGAEYERSAWWFSHDPDGLEAAARIAEIWRRHYGYDFNVRDVHLLTGLARGGWTARKTRGDLRAELAASLIPRKHSPQELSNQFSGADPSMRFDLIVDRLSMADLWNLSLLDAMLARLAIRSGLAEMARRDRMDREGLGGLVFYADGKAEARLYPGGRGAGDGRYAPSAQAAEDERDSLCRFWGRFGSGGAVSVGPDPRDLADARRANFYGLVISGTGPDRFCAHYLSPGGLIVSLGEFDMPSPQPRSAAR